MEKKIKVVWLCHFSTLEIQEYIKPRKRLAESGLWVRDALEIIENDPRFDIHIVCSYGYFSGIKRFNIRGVHYYCYNSFMPFIGRNWPAFFPIDMFLGYIKNKIIVNRIVKKINPDIIHLYGAENPHYSATILPLIKKYPTILTIQGFASKLSDESIFIRNRKIIENKIISKIPIAFYRTNQMKKDLKNINPNIQLVWGTFSSEKVESIEPVTHKRYDIVYFARICKEKGFDDLLQAVKLISKKKLDVSLCVIGAGTMASQYKAKAKDLGISDNIFWAGYQPTLEDVHKLAIQAKVSVLPTHNDMIPGTIIESMLLHIPVISYYVDSIPEINENGEAIRLVDKGDVEQLADAIYEFITSEELCKLYADKGYKRAVEMFTYDDNELRNALYFGYQEAIKLFKTNRL